MALPSFDFPSDREQLFVNAVSAADHYEDMRGRMNQLLRQGWLDLAEAKYARGTQAVSHVQYPAHNAALLRAVPGETRDGHESTALQLEIDGDGINASSSTLRSHGGLVHPSMRRAQQSFVEASEYALKTVNAARRAQQFLDKVQEPGTDSRSADEPGT